MSNSSLPFQSIAEFIALQPQKTQSLLKTLYTHIIENAPKATEKISWGMPTFYQEGNLVHFFAYKNHIGFYPGSSGVETFIPELGLLKYSKGAIQFPLDQPLPLDLIAKIVRFRVDENITMAKAKKQK